MTLKEIKKLKIDKYSKETLIKFRKSELDRLKKRRKEGLCCAVLNHGPGHQSKTFCELKGKHKIHECKYGSYEQCMRWKGKEACTSFFDYPVKLKA